MWLIITIPVIPRKSDLCKEAEECMDRLAAENDTMRKELLSKDELLSQYSAKLEKTNELLKMSSSSNKKFQKKLNAKKYDVEVILFFLIIKSGVLLLH